MPNIIINEYDNTTTPITEYSNFAVVIPGLVKTGYGKDDNGNSVFDENGIYECSSQADFAKYIGKVAAAQVTVAATEANPIIINAESDDPEKYMKFITARDIERYGADSFYIGGPIEGQDTVNGRLQKSFTIDVNEVPTTQIYQFTKVSPVIGNRYFIITKGNEGTDPTTSGENGHYGNQMAYELLGLGYKVLYKGLNLNESGELDTDPDIIKTLKDDNFWAPLKDKGTYDFRYIVSGLINADSSSIIKIQNNMSALAAWQNNIAASNNGRGDCIALLDIPSYVYSGADRAQSSVVESIKSYTKFVGDADKNSAFIGPYVIYGPDASYDAEYGHNTTFPASMDYLVCANKSINDLHFNEWYAISGFTRGLSKFSIVGTGYKFGELAASALQLRKAENDYNKAVNLIVKIRGNYYLWGNRTAAALESGDDANLKASHFLNIRQLCCTLKKQIYIACRKFTFDPNSDTLWYNFVGAIEPTLKKMQSDQGIQNYQFIKVKSAERATLNAIIRIVPIEAVEDFKIDVTLEDSIDGTVISVSEE